MSIGLVRDAIELSCEVIEYKSCFVLLFEKVPLLPFTSTTPTNSMSQSGSISSAQSSSQGEPEYTMSPENASVIAPATQISNIVEEAHVRPLLSNSMEVD